MPNTNWKEFTESAPIQVGNSIYFLSFEKIDAEVENITWMVYVHRVKLNKLDEPEEAH